MIDSKEMEEVAMTNRSDFANPESQIRPICFDTVLSELDASLGLDSVAAAEYETGNREAATRSHTAAQKGYRSVVNFIAEAHGVSVEQKQALDPKLALVKAALARLKEFARRNRS